jgi:ABC-2 type transport system ATP-binding protein
MAMEARLAVEIKGVVKEFAAKKAVRGVSFSVAEGEILGLVGPNGAGKTTTIRMLLNIIHPDEGEVRVFGAPLTEEAKDRIGYLPEERGLYRDRKVWETLIYLAALKGVDTQTASRRAGQLLERVGMEGTRNSKVRELSRGMSQLIQFVATVLHNPKLVVLDEPFSGLDPVNVRLMKGVVSDLRKQDTSFVLSAHQMNQVEELCDRVVMIDQGEVVLNGRLADVKRRFGDNSIRVACDRMPSDLSGVASIKNTGSEWELALNEGTKAGDVLHALLDRGVQVERYEVALPSLEEIFVRVVKERR